MTLRRRSGQASLRVVLSRLVGLFRPGSHDEELNQEIETHLELLVDDYVRRGISEADARNAACRAFGGVDRTKAAYRDQRGLPILDALMQDVRFALRLLVRDRGFAVTAILVLGLGIGVNNMMFTLIYGSTMRGLPIPEPDRVLHVSTFDQRFPDRPLSFPEFDELRAGARTFQGLAAFVNRPVAVSDEGRAADRFDGTYLSANAFGLVGTAPVLGRAFAEADDRPGAQPVAVLGASAWRSRYASDPAILGRSILVDGTATTVVGVMPEPSRFPSTAQVWLPLASLPTLDARNREARTLRVFGRVRPGLAVSDARVEVEAIIDRGARANPRTSQGLQGRVVPIEARFFGSPTQAVWIAFCAAAILIVVVSSANAANLMLARAALRAREIAIRGSLGATRLRVIGQLLIESLVIAALAGTVGLGVSLAGIRLLQSAIPEGTMPYWIDYSFDMRVLAALLTISFATVLVFGLVPAIQASRTDVNRVLRDGGRSGTGRGGTRGLTTAFLVAEFALTVVLLAQLVESFQRDGLSLPSDAVVDTTDVLTASVTLPAAKYRDAEERYAFFLRLGDRLRAGAGVSGFSVASVLPLGAAQEQHLEIDGLIGADNDRAPAVRTVSIAPHYFDTLALPVQEGRDFTEQDGLPGREVAIVSQAFVETYLPDTAPAGQRIRLRAANAPASAARWLTTVGVVPSIRQRTTLGTDATVYLPLRAAPPNTASVLVRSALAPADITKTLRAEVMAIDPYLPLYRVMTMAQAVDEAQWNGRVSHRLITALTLIALCISVVGLYAVTAHAVTQRTQEIGIRMALGANAFDVRNLILRRAAVQVGVGFVLGVAGSMLWSSAIFSGRVVPLVSPSVLVPVSVVLALITVSACLVPTRRATRLDPVAALRRE